MGVKLELRMFDYFILKGRTPVKVKSVLTWSRWSANNRKKKILKQETLPNGLFVSTIFLGLDHNFIPSAPPQLFETMVFPKEGDWSEKDMERYST